MKKHLLMLSLGAIFLFPTMGIAHNPIFSCFDNGDNTITCEGGFSDGAKATGMRLAVYDTADKKLHAGRLNENSEYTFDKPTTDYKVTFNAGSGHIVEIKSQDIVK